MANILKCDCCESIENVENVRIWESQEHNGIEYVENYVSKDLCGKCLVKFIKHLVSKDYDFSSLVANNLKNFKG